MEYNTDYEEKKRAHRRAVTTFIEERLYPEIAARLPEVFPEYDFKKSGSTYYSRYSIEGTDTKKAGALYCSPTIGKPISIGGNGSRSGESGTGIEVLKLYAERHHLSGRDEAAEAIAAILNISGFPKWEGYKPGESAKEDKTEADKVAAAAAFTKALEEKDTPEAEEVRAYLRSRFTEAEYKEAVAKHLIGYADTEVLDTLERTAPLWHKGALQKNIGTIHRIAVITPYGMNTADSFNFRALPKDEEAAAEANKGKYDMPNGTARDVLGGLPYGAESVIVVEGEIDRLKAALAIGEENKSRRLANKPLLKGLNIVSVGTNQIGEKKALEALKRGVKRFTIIPDTDTPKEVVDTTTAKARLQFTHELAGTSGALRSIGTLYAAGAEEVYIATLPAAEVEGKEVKDTADYITAFGVVEWIKAINSTKVSALPYKAEVALRRYIEEVQYYGLNEEKRDTLFKELEGLLYDTHATHDTAEKIYAIIKRYTEGGNAEHFRLNIEAFRAYVEGRKERLATEEAATTFKATLGDTAKKVEAGEITATAAAARIKEVLATTERRSAADYSALYATPTSTDDIEASFRDVAPGIPTGLFVQTVEKEKKEVTFKEGVSLVVGARKHGKTTFLYNLALNEAERNIEAHRCDPTAPLKKVLLITYEVRKPRLLREILATYLYKRNTRCGLTKEDIAAYYDKGIKPEGMKLTYFLTEKARFMEEYLISGALTVVDLTDKKDIEDLIALISQYLSGEAAEGGVSLVALDYIQKLTTREKDKKASRPMELKYIGEVLTDFGVKHALPIVAAAQFNRISNLLEVDTTNIGEAGDLERNAVDIIGIFNLKELKPLIGSDYTLGFGLHKNIFSRFGIAERDFIEEVPTGEYYANTKANEAAGIAGKEKTRPNIKPIPEKIYISLLASRYGGFPAEVVTNFVGAAGYIDFPATSTAVEDSIKRLKKWEEIEAQRLGMVTTTAAPEAEEAKAPTPEEGALPF